MRLLVTGGAGFIGSNFVRRSLKGSLSGISSIVVLDKLTYAGVKENLKSVSGNPAYSFVLGDICDSDLVSSLIETVDAVVNFAAESHVDRSIASASGFVETNTRGVQVILDAIKNVGPNKRFLQVNIQFRCSYDSLQQQLWNSSFS